MRVACIWLACVCSLIVGLPSAGAVNTQTRGAEDLVMIIAPSAGIADIPSSVLRAAYGGQRTEYRGVRLIPFNAPMDTPIRERLDRALLGLERSDVGNFWVNQRVRDGRQPPRAVPSTDLALRVVAQLEGAIACVSAAAVDGSVRALRIDGKGPNDPGYLLALR